MSNGKKDLNKLDENREGIFINDDSSSSADELTAAGVDFTKELSDEDLKDATGGLWGITIIDTCKNEYDFNTCYINFEGCPNLVVHSKVFTGQTLNGKKEYNFVFSCNKGCFNQLSVSKLLSK